MPLDVARVEALAPDQASLDAARKLLKPAQWPTLAVDGGHLAWGECQGSGASPYRVVVSELDSGYKCSCPSRKFPCKHTLALMWLRAEAKAPFSQQPVPGWVTDWLARRKSGSGASATIAPTEQGPKASISALAPGPEPQIDPAAEARAAAARERNRLERESAILAGLDELDLWLADQLDTGLVTFVTRAAQSCRVIAQRLTDAKASGLAARLDSLPSRLFGLPPANRSRAAIAELGMVHLIAEAYRRQETLPAPLVQDARRRVGWATSREALLTDESATRIAAR